MFLHIRMEQRASMCRGKHKECRGWNSGKCRWGRGPSNGEEGQTKKEEAERGASSITKGRLFSGREDEVGDVRP